MKKSLQIDDFWKKYLDAVLKGSVPMDKAEWYRIKGTEIAARQKSIHTILPSEIL